MNKKQAAEHAATLDRFQITRLLANYGTLPFDRLLQAFNTETDHAALEDVEQTTAAGLSSKLRAAETRGLVASVTGSETNGSLRKSWRITSEGIKFADTLDAYVLGVDDAMSDGVLSETRLSMLEQDVSALVGGHDSLDDREEVADRLLDLINRYRQVTQQAVAS